MSHLKRIRVPKSWPLEKRKYRKYIARPLPGPHKLMNSITLDFLLKDILKIAKTTKEVKLILNKGYVLIDNVVRKNHKFPVGLIDTISLPELNQYYIILFNQGKFSIHPTTKGEADSKICKIVGKKILKGKKLQLNLYDGKNILVDKDEYKVGDSIIISQNKIKKHLKFEKGALIYLTDGKHKGTISKLEEIQHFKGITPDRVILKYDNKKITTRKDYAFVIEKEFK
ncbi:MAG: 30S ribosomal protein S4e [Nanoarchaeota archaeon]